MYEYQGFHSGGKLKATQLVAMEDGIIEAQKAVREICYEDNAYEPITWDGKMEGREYFDFSAATEEEPGTVYVVKISDVILTSEDFVGSTFYWSDGESEHVEEDWVMPPEMSMAYGIYGIDGVYSIFDTTKASIATGVTFPSTGLYIRYRPSEGYYFTKLSKTIIKKIDEKFLPELASGANMEKGTGPSASQQLPDGVAEGFDFTGKNPNAEAIDNTLSAVQPYGATGEFAAAFGGKASAQGRRAFACGTTTIAKGKYSFAAGENTAALGNSSSAEGMQSTSVGYASHAQNALTVAYGDGSHAQNYQTKAVGNYSTALGVDTMAVGIASCAGGRGTVATVDSQMVVGRYNNESNALFAVGNGTDGNHRSTAFEVFEDGSVRVAAAPQHSLDVVRQMDLAASVSRLSRNVADGTANNAIRQKGATSSAAMAAAFNEGKALGEVSFATGSSTASGWLATATGYATVASTAASFSAGQGTQTGKDCQTVVGRYNLGTQGLFEVGCGSAENRFNGLAVHPDGYLIIRRADGQYYNLNLILDALNGWADAAKI